MTINISPAELATLIRNLQGGGGPAWKAVDLPAARRGRRWTCRRRSGKP